MAFGKMDWNTEDATVTIWVYSTEDWRRTVVKQAEMAMKLFPDAKFIRFHTPTLRTTAEGAGIEPATELPATPFRGA